MDFPDTSLNALGLLVLAGAATGLAGTALEAVFGDPSSALGQVLLLVAALVVGFGAVYAPYAYAGSQRSDRREKAE